jgi:hypothetical protein
MREFLRKCRGVLGMGAVFAAAWAVILTGIAMVIGVFDPDSIDPGEGPGRIAAIGAMVGFITGAGFGALLALAERRRSLRDLSIWRSALWGAVAPAAWALLTTVNDSMMILLCPVGAALAAGSVALAKRAERNHLAEGTRQTASLLPDS